MYGVDAAECRPMADDSTQEHDLLAHGLQLGDARTDATHLEMLELVGQVQQADDASRPARFYALVAHTQAHFAQEEEWMLATGITATHCHFGQHAEVLQVLQEVERRTRAGDAQYIGRALEALLEWFVPHALNLDAGLVAHLQRVGFDTSTGTLAAPLAAGLEQNCSPAEKSSGCGHGSAASMCHPQGDPEHERDHQH